MKAGGCRRAAGCALAVLLLAWVAGARAAELRVFAAASLADALEEIGRLYQEETGDLPRFSFGSSHALARQIREGARADVFFAADERAMNTLEPGGLILAGTRHVLLSNTLVVVMRAESRSGLKVPADLLGLRRIALGETRSVPAGIYAREYLEGLGLWSRLADRVVPTENVRAALSAVVAGNVDAAVVYASDVRSAREVRVALVIPADQGPRITYPVAVCGESRQPERARAFVAFLGSAHAAAVFTRHGFLPAAVPR